MSDELKVQFPDDLTDIIEKTDVRFHGHGKIIDYSDKEGFGLYREADVLSSVQMFDVDQAYLDARGLKAGDTVVYVSYPMDNGRTVFDVFAIKK